VIYRHQRFKLDTKSQRVFDENDKELSITGNAFRLLVFLCARKNATLTDINDHFDPAGAKEYTENHIRQYRHKINSLIGHDITAYRNRIYSINGEVSASVEDMPKAASDTKRETSGFWRKKLSGKEKLVILISVLFLIIFSTSVLGNKNRDINDAGSASTSSADSGPKPPDEMILIPEGIFLMGSTEQQALAAWRENDSGYGKESYLAEYPQRKIALPDFYIDKKEVSNGDFKMFVDATHHTAPALWADQNLNSSNRPVVGVSWNDADAYCRWLGKRLPTEPEWEKAARGMDGRIWPWGNSWDPTKDNHGNGTEYGLDGSDGYEYTAPVGAELGASPYGALNMAGNVYEWVADDFDAYPENDRYDQPDFGKGFKVIKGGAYTDGKIEQRPASRIGYQKDFKDVDIGFRCARNE
jgi:iron(II)-dependent oxidoreductase